MKGGATFAAGEAGTAFSFDGSTGYVEVPDNDLWAFGTSDFTIEFWVNFRALNPSSSVAYPSAVFIANDEGWYSVNKWLASLGDNKLCFIVSSPTLNDHFLIQAPFSPNLNQWYHLAIVRAGSLFTAYSNGVPIGSQSDSLSIPNPNAPLTIGQGEATFFLNGLMDEVSIYNRALTASELVSVYNAGCSGKCAGASPPVIVSQPESQTATTGDAVTFTVSAIGTQPLAFQWSFNGSPLGGATSSILVLTNVQTASAGTYSVLVTNTAGSALSSNALLSVFPAGQCAPAPAGLIGWWRGEANANDSVGINNGVLKNGAGYAAGEVGGAFSLNGINSYVEIPDSDQWALGTNDFTIEFWTNLRALPASSSVSSPAAIFVANDQGPYSVNKWFVSLGGGKLCFVVSSPTLGDHFLIQAPFAPKLNQWYHMAVVRTGSLFTAYSNGVAIGSASDGLSIPNANAPLTIGQGEGAFFLNGLMDEVSIYRRALTPGELTGIVQAGAGGKCGQSIAPTILTQPQPVVVRIGGNASFSVVASGSSPLTYQWRVQGSDISWGTASTLVLTNVQSADAGAYSVVVSSPGGAVVSVDAALTVLPPPVCAPAPSGMAAWWRGDGDATDSIGSTPGTLKGGASFGVGKAAGAFAFNGSSGYVEVPDSDLWAFGTNAFAIEFWVNFQALGPSSSVAQPAAVFLANDEGQNVVNKWLFSLGGGKLCLIVSSPSIRDHYLIQAPFVPALNQWYHLAVVRDGNVFTAYVNGLAVGSETNSLAIPNPNAPLTIGQGEGAFFVNGLMDEVSIYRRALSPAEVQAVYSADSAGKCQGSAAPVIVMQPVSQSAFAGSNATLTVTALGTPPMGYQWLFNGTEVAGATASGLTLTNVSPEQAGTYSVQVTNQYGAASSSNAILAVVVLAPVLTDDFDPSIDAAQWSAFGGTVLATNYGGYVSPPNSLWFGGQGSRFAATRPLDTTTGGYIQFDLRLAKGTSYPWDPVEWSDGVVLESSINAGATWVRLGTYNPAFYTNWMQYSDWTEVALPIPVAAQARSTVFRWRQLSNSGAMYDNWALDNITIATGPAAPIILSQPQGQSAYAWDTVVFNVIVGGTAPFAFQWQKAGIPIDGATSSSLVLSSVQYSDAGTYTVAITNSAGYAISSNAVLTVSKPPSLVQVPDTAAVAGTVLTLPILLRANGDENALGFSLSFDPAVLSYTDINLGATAAGASLLVNTNQAATGKLGVAVSLPADAKFLVGTQEVVRITFTVAVLPAATTTSVAFADTPTTRQISDSLAQRLQANFIGGAIAVARAQLEGDVSPRPEGDGALEIIDWVLVGRYAAMLDSPTNTGEFQRADCAPRATLGDGFITVADWVQAGRYAAGLDPLTVTGGPITQGTGAAAMPRKKDNGQRQVTIDSAVLLESAPGEIPVKLLSQGNENALGFSLNFDPTALKFVGARLGEDATGAALNVNATQVGSGHVSVLVALPANKSFTVGAREVVKVSFQAANGTSGSYPLAFVDTPVRREVADCSASVLAASYVNGTAAVNPQPAMRIAVKEQAVTLAWPLWASNYLVQESAGALGSSMTWTNTTLSAVTNQYESSVTFKAGEAGKFYRLMKR